MKLTNLTLLAFFLSLSILGLGQDQTTLSGKIKKARGKMIYLQHNNGNKVVSIDSSKINFFGKFKLQTEVAKDDFYQVTIDKKEIQLLLLKSGQKVKLKSSNDFSNKNYTVSGSEDSKLIQEFMVVKTNKDISKDSLKTFAQNFIETNASSLVVFVALNDAKDVKKAITVSEKGIGKSYPNSNYHNSLKSALQQITKAEQAQKQAQKQTKGGVGTLAPELNMVSPEGKLITLESLRGKYVLIDFWASWCGPCRRENPNVVKLYNQYKDKGFDVYSVSLDKNKSSWIAAIKKDNLTWPSHVSDLKGWGSKATGLYGFRGIPYTVLIDKEGKIIATRLRGAALENKLKQLFGE